MSFHHRDFLFKQIKVGKQLELPRVISCKDSKQDLESPTPACRCCLSLGKVYHYWDVLRWNRYNCLSFSGIHLV